MFCRRTRARAILMGMAVLAACGDPASVPPPRGGGDDLLVVTSGAKVALVRPGGGTPVFADAVTPSGSFGTVARVKRSPNGPGTLLEVVDPATDVVSWSRMLPEPHRVKLVSEDGRFVALSPVAERSYATGRSQTQLSIASAEAEELRAFTLSGNYEPEAFSVDGESLFVIEYLPANAPNRYRVRRLDVPTAEVVDVFTPDEELQDSMRGTARVQAMSSDGRRLYTLYTVGKGTATSAFIHVLSLDELWAHCIDLPGEFAPAAESATALALSPDDETLYVANTAADVVAALGARSLEVERTSVAAFDPGGSSHGAIAGDSLFVASDRTLVELGTEQLDYREHRTFPARITGLQVAADGSKLYIGLAREIVVLDVESGAAVERVDPVGVRTISRFGRAPRVLEEPERDPSKADGSRPLKCAC